MKLEDRIYNEIIAFPDTILSQIRGKTHEEQLTHLRSFASAFAEHGTSGEWPDHVTLLVAKITLVNVNTPQGKEIRKEMSRFNIIDRLLLINILKRLDELQKDNF